MSATTKCLRLFRLNSGPGHNLRHQLSLPHLPSIHILKRMMGSNSTSDVLFERIGNKGVITLNRPKALNALNLPMVKEIGENLRRWESEVAFVIVRSNSEKAFCAGGDVVAVKEQVERGDENWSDFFTHEYRMNHLIGTYEIPQVALIHGVTMGGGVGLSVHGKYRVATEKTVFAMPETLIGMIPDVGATYFLPRLKGNLGRFLAFTGHRLVGYDVLRAGVATHFCDSHKMQNEEKLGNALETRRLKDLQNDLLSLDDARCLDRLLESYTEASILGKKQESSLKPNIETLFSDATVEGVLSALERDGSEWASKQRDTIRTMVSPTSLKLSARLIEEGKNLDLKGALILEFNLLHKVIGSDGDFREGIRARLVDKDNKPVWRPLTLEEVDEGYVDSFFVKAPKQLEIS